MQPASDREKKFLEYYEAHADAIFRHCYFRVYSKARAEELTQDTFMKAWEYVNSGREVENMKAFLYRIATNLVIDESRKKKEASLDGLLEESDAYHPVVDGKDEAERQVLLNDVMKTLEKLPEDMRELIVMRYVNDLEPKEIAEVLDMTANNVSVKLHRAVEALRRFTNTE